jgi:hypothetical protein
VAGDCFNTTGQKTYSVKYLKGRHNLMRLKPTLKLLLCLILVVFFSTSLHAGGSFTLKWGKDSEPAQQQAKEDHKKVGPPAHAPAHGYRAKQQYRYYPDQKVYHDPERGLYFYLKGDNWEVGASLPSPLRSALGESVSIELDTDKPYVNNAEHVKMYPPKKSNGAKQKGWAKKK